MRWSVTKDCLGSISVYSMHLRLKLDLSQDYCDDSAVVGCVRDGRESLCREVGSNFVERPQRTRLLNVTNTKEIVLDSRRSRILNESFIMMNRGEIH